MLRIPAPCLRSEPEAGRSKRTATTSALTNMMSVLRSGRWIASTTCRVALRLIGRSLKPDAPLIGAIAGGNSLPALRAALIEAGRYEGRIFARTHPRIDPGTLAQLLTSADFRCRWWTWIASGFATTISMRWSAIYAQWARPRSWRNVRRRCPGLSCNLPGRPLLRGGLTTARRKYVEILHFLAWTK